MVDDIQQSISSLAIFLAAGGRIAPSLIRLQQNLLSLNNNHAQASSTITLLINSDQTMRAKILRLEKRLESKISIRSLTYMHKDSSRMLLNDINEIFEPGEIIAVIGDSGSGKTTLMNLLIGALIPTSGSINIGKVPISEFIVQNPYFIGYVPQEVKIIKGTVAENITLSTNVEVEEVGIWQVLKDVKLDQKIRDFPLGVFQEISEDGNNLSGGERQRLGLARALFGKPRILFLDEATSSLDPQVEREILDMLEEYRGKMTILFITHRESTLSLADRVFRLSDKGVLTVVSNVN
jgi:ABC-type bacteriocin/lantibiotic exporter with double-glycine peptidase domain